MLPLAEFMLENVQWSLELAIRAAKGESIHEPGDMDKEMDIFIQKRRGPAPNNSDVEVLDQIVLQYVKPVLEKLDRLCERQGSELFGRYWPNKYARLGSSGGVSGDVFGADQWGSTKEKYLESLTKLFEVVPTDEYTSDVEQGLLDISPPLPAHS